MHKGKTGETYCVGGGAQRNGVQVAETILQVLGKPKELVEFVKERPGHDMRYDIDNSYIQQKLGWQPGVSFEEGIAKTINWYKNNQGWSKTFAQRMDLMRDKGLYDTKEKQ